VVLRYLGQYGRMTAFRQQILLMVAAAAAPCAVAQPALDVSASDPETQILEQLREIEAQSGSNSSESIGPMTGLALIHQENGDHELALAMIEQARGVVSVNHGLYSLEEVPLLRMAIQSEEARGNAARAWDLEHELLNIVARYPDDLRTYPVYREVAGKRADVLEDYRRGGFPPQIILGCYYGAESCRAGSRGVVIWRLRGEISRYYQLALYTLLHNDPSSDELRTFLGEALPVVHQHNVYVDVAPAFRRLLEQETANPESPRSRPDVLIQIADWNVAGLHRLSSTPLSERATRVLTQHELPLEQYGLAYEELKKAGIDQTSIDAIFAPSMPVVLPAFLPNPLASEASGAIGYIDVAFDVTPHGYAENVEVLGATKSLIKRVERDLVSLIEQSPFRPRTTHGEFAERSRVEVRYYVRSMPP
jgi:tetratricopeptide (TPR) repeat protein